MTTNYVAVSASSKTPSLKLIALDSTGTQVSGNLVVPSLQDVTISNANDVFTWSQLNESAKLQVATTSTNSVSTNVVVEELTFFGSNAAGTSASALGLIGLSKNKTKCDFEIVMGTKTFTGQGYVTGLAPTVSADSPVWVTPVTITVSGEYAFTPTVTS